MVAVFGASSPQSRSTSRSVATTRPGLEQEDREQAALPLAAERERARSRPRPRAARGSGIRASRATLERRAGLCPASGTQITRTRSRPAQSRVSELLVARCRPVGGRSDRAGHDTPHVSLRGSTSSRPGVAAAIAAYVRPWRRRPDIGRVDTHRSPARRIGNHGATTPPRSGGVRVSLAGQAVPQQHPVRGFFGDPRIANHGESRQFHFGIDISAPNGTPVYATLTGTAYIHPLHATTIVIVGTRRSRVQLLARRPRRARADSASSPTGRSSATSRSRTATCTSRKSAEAATSTHCGPARWARSRGHHDRRRARWASRRGARRGGLRRDAARRPAPVAGPARHARARAVATARRAATSSRLETAVDFRLTIPPASAFDRSGRRGRRRTTSVPPATTASCSRRSPTYAQACTWSSSQCRTAAATRRAARFPIGLSAS